MTMSKKVKKKPMAATVSGDIDELNEKDKLSFMKKEYKLARDTIPNYEVAKNEMNKYIVDLPQNPDYQDLSEINKLYALAQSYSSRVTAIEMIAIDNQARWKRLVELLEAYIEDKRSELLVSEEFEEYTVQKAEAKAHTLLKKEFKTLRRLKNKAEEANSFYRMIATKKKDLTSVLTTLGKQVKALSLEKSIQ
jgi:hypothetical protein